MKGWLVVAALVGGLSLWGWAGHLPVYPFPAPVGSAVVQVHQPAVQASPAASSGSHHGLRGLYAVHRVFRVRRVVRWVFNPHVLPWFLR